MLIVGVAAISIISLLFLMMWRNSERDLAEKLAEIDRRHARDIKAFDQYADAVQLYLEGEVTEDYPNEMYKRYLDNQIN